jgi:hypothetical protein
LFLQIGFEYLGNVTVAIDGAASLQQQHRGDLRRTLERTAKRQPVITGKGYLLLHGRRLGRGGDWLNVGHRATILAL